MAFSFSTKTTLKDGAQLDAAGRLRVSGLTNLIDCNLRNIINPALATTHEASGGTVTHLPNESAATLACTTTVGSIARISSRQPATYIAGSGLLATITGILDTGNSTGVANRIGYFDDSDGFFFRHLDGVVSVVKRSSVTGSTVETVIASTSWDDPMDGTGVSGITADFTKGQIFFIDLLWLSLGQVRLGVHIGGRDIICHSFQTANEATTAHIKTPNLFTRWECEQIDGNNTGTLKAICGAVSVEASYNPSGVLGAFETGDTLATVTTTEEPVFAIRALSTYNNIQVFPTIVEMLTDSNRQIIWRFYLNSTVTGGTWDSQIAKGNLVEINTTMTSVSGGKHFFTASATDVTASAGADFAEKTGLGYQGDGSPDILIITAEAVGGTGNSYIAFNWKEIY